jgi:GT2 family glycosyltransferase
LLGAVSYSPNGYIIKSSEMYVNNGSLAVKRDLYINVGGINPAQVGDYVIGDGEGGFCRKIHRLGIPMAFTDEVTMYHRQFVGKNDTIKDIRRRFENNIGITNAYKKVVVKGVVEKHKIFPTLLKMVWYAFTGRRRKCLRQYFMYCAEKKYNEYVDRYQYDDALKELLKSNNYQWKK